MKPFFFILVTGVLLSSCAPKTQAVTGPQIAKLEKGETRIINTTLNLFTFPRSVIYQIDEDKVYRVREFNVHIAGDHPHTRTNLARNISMIQPGDLADQVIL